RGRRRVQTWGMARATAARGKPQPWPAFRGPNGAGIADGQGAVTEWSVASGANVGWKTQIPGLATSSPIVWGDRVIVASASSADDTSFRTGLYGDVKPVDGLPEHTYALYMLDRTSGPSVWRQQVFKAPPLTRRHTKSSHANATPVTDGRHIVAVFGSGGLLVCYSMEGTLLWLNRIGPIDSGWFLDGAYQWGHASSPIIYKSTVILQADQSKGS